MPIDKAALRAQLIEQLDATRDGVAAAQRAVQEGATHAEARQEGSKDMRSTEASYIARGQAMRVSALDNDRARVLAMELRDFATGDAVAVSALVTIATEQGRRQVFIAPAGGGLVLTHGAQRVQVVTPVSPLGEALIGSAVGDVVTVERGRADEEIEVVAIA